MTTTYFRDLMLYGTVRIECFNDGDIKSSIGTGFFHTIRAYDKTIDQYREFDLIVTNRHVVHDLKNNIRYKNVRMSIHVKNEADEVDHKNYKTLSHTDLQSIVIYHPNPDIDLAVILTQPFFNALEQSGHEQKFISNSMFSMMADLRKFATREIAMIGYPMGHWDAENNMPMIR